MSYCQNESLVNLVNDVDTSPSESSLLHPYPGSMPAFLASRLIQRYSDKGNLIFDPFCGSGVTLVEGIRLNRSCIGTDLQDSVVRIANGALNIPEADILLSAWDYVRKRAINSTSLFRLANNQVVAENLTKLQPWFHKRTFEIILSIATEIDNVGIDAQDILRILLAGSLINLSKRRERGTVHWGWIADNVLPKHDELVFVDPISVVNDKLLKLISFVTSLNSYNLLQKSECYASIIKHNWLNDNQDFIHDKVREVDLLLTSPPYPYSIDYSLALRLTNYYFGFDFKEEKQFEIGARFKRKRKNKNQDYLSELSNTLYLLSSFVRNGGYAVLVLPNPLEYSKILCFDKSCWLEYIRKSFSGNWVLVEYASRTCQNRRLTNANLQERNEIVAAFKRI